MTENVEITVLPPKHWRIPKTIHIIHLSSKNFDDAKERKTNITKKCISSWIIQHLHHDGIFDDEVVSTTPQTFSSSLWTIKIWTDDCVQPQTFPQLYNLIQSAKTKRQKQDLMKYEILFTEGGFATEDDIFCFSKLDFFIDPFADLVISDAFGLTNKKVLRVLNNVDNPSNPPFCDTSFIACVPGHLALVDCIHNLLQKSSSSTASEVETHDVESSSWTPSTHNEIATRSDSQETVSGCCFFGQCVFPYLDAPTVQILPPIMLYHWLSNGWEYISKRVFVIDQIVNAYRNSIDGVPIISSTESNHSEDKNDYEIKNDNELKEIITADVKDVLFFVLNRKLIGAKIWV